MFRKRYVILGAWVACFLVGYFTWKIFHTGTLFLGKQAEDGTLEDLDFTVYVGDYLITPQDIEWEYNFYLKQLNAAPSAEGGTGQAKAPEKPVFELYNKIMADLIERKLLYQFIASDQKFNINEPSRFTHCLEQWTSTVREQGDLFGHEKTRNQLKSMLCEKDILHQYLKERIAGQIVLMEPEMKEYYLTHKSEFHEPTRVRIRQIVLASEAEAKKARARVNIHNFESIAREVSISPEAKEGGLLGPFAKSDMPSVFEVAFEMTPGEIQGILKSTYGFHIIMLDRKYPKADLSFEAAKGRIQEILKKKRQDEEYKKWVEMALNTIPIKSSRAL
ncbi:MAG TPA: peptidyl-prolyl cis-trans isomerase [Oligoflexus sp.]|uniref:peptidylprolyl isomerase n=1 Tax=Oligoflexus sp. TaxID=1971216 RepID=UPI002D24D3D5|nr:peptidyl-prolyl cis-trans isomerase [Oligoflexus sp.]HYX34797.1 peptidyl-prolyl cis-trans isomerase [Oligoflexus sp.]